MEKNSDLLYKNPVQADAQAKQGDPTRNEPRARPRDHDKFGAIA